MGEMWLPGRSDLHGALGLRWVPNELQIDEVTRDCRLLMYLSRLNASFGKWFLRCWQGAGVFVLSQRMWMAHEWDKSFSMRRWSSWVSLMLQVSTSERPNAARDKHSVGQDMNKNAFWEKVSMRQFLVWFKQSCLANTLGVSSHNAYTDTFHFMA